MAAKKLIVEAGVNVKASGCWELASPLTGKVLFLIDEPQAAITIAGKEVFSSALDALPERLVFVQNGGDWQRK